MLVGLDDSESAVLYWLVLVYLELLLIPPSQHRAHHPHLPPFPLSKPDGHRGRTLLTFQSQTHLLPILESCSSHPLFQIILRILVSSGRLALRSRSRRLGATATSATSIKIGLSLFDFKQLLVDSGNIVHCRLFSCGCSVLLFKRSAHLRSCLRRYEGVEGFFVLGRPISVSFLVRPS